MKEANKLNKKTSKINLQRTSKMYNKERGITLIALVITVVILIILATVSINVVLGEGGLIQRAQQAKELTEQAALEEQQGLNSLMSEFTNIMAEDQNPPEEKSEVEEAKESGTPFGDTTTITDDLDNPIKVPGGFNIAEDSGTKVEEGIVIEDSNNNQFVWIPVGEYNVSKTINSTGKLTNELSRREWADENVVAEPTLVNGDDVIGSSFYGEGNENSVAKDQIDAFKTSSTTNKGFYIGRYEAGTEAERTSETAPLTTPLVQANKYPYVYVSRNDAKQQAEAMYSGNEFITSQLISSYAWDTALNFICQTNEEGYLLATTIDSAYGNIGTVSSTKTGEYEADNYSNIHDLLGNCYEWTTEYANSGIIDGVIGGITGSHDTSCVYRGGYNDINYYAAFRNFIFTSNSYTLGSFRLQLYINPES